jgi:nicotinamidase-related amidase
VTKQRVGAFHGTSLDETLRQQGVIQVFLTGIATSIGVESTARSAHDLGYNVVLVVDAMTNRDAEAHRLSVEKIFPRLGETAKTDDVLKLLNDRRKRAYLVV